MGSLPTGDPVEGIVVPVALTLELLRGVATGGGNGAGLTLISASMWANMFMFMGAAFDMLAII